MITGDFNIHVNNSSDSHSVQFLTLLDSFTLEQHVSAPAHISNNILDLVITSTQSNILSSIVISPVSPPEHYRVMSSLNFQPPHPKPATLDTFRHIKSIDCQSLCDDIANSVLVSDPPSTLSELVTCYNSTLTAILDRHAPVQSKLITSSKSLNFEFLGVIVAAVNDSGEPFVTFAVFAILDLAIARTVGTCLVHSKLD